ncbi:hypothetical protein AYO44_09300 [Planctomycetaceae bacterium SCGC AG-212-F19]|nr:hypothetical protein AYO44_09300 [Planctomycetaceae bacterium SCGC AG-212-F19]
MLISEGCLWVRAWFHDRPVVEAVSPGYADDASRMNRTEVAETVPVAADPRAAEAQLRDLLHRARTQGKRVAIAGARHSMGGHTIYPDGIILDMLPFRQMELDTERSLLKVGAGARWSEVVPYLDARGYSVAIMQSNNDFSVGGSVSVNCHGWQHDQPPIASTVERLRLMKADGTIVRCSRDENTELFGLALGGYGLIGIILDLELHVVRNERYRPEVEVLPAERYVTLFTEKVLGATDVGMAYGRLCVVPGEQTFLREAILTVFHKSPCRREEIPALQSPGYGALRRAVHRAQIGSQAGKEARWKAEKGLGNQLASRWFSRNQLLNEGADVYREHNADRTDVLHEYFVPPEQVTPFLDLLRVIIPRHHGDLLNVTVRTVREDKDVFLRYADRDMFAFVLMFSQERTADADRQMEGLTQELIDAALACGGRYYLPYRLHARPEQLRLAYPQVSAFFDFKSRHDPDGIFQNQWYLKYR